MSKSLSDIVDEVHNKSPFAGTKTQTADIVAHAFAAVADALNRGEDVRINNFGTFYLHERKARQGRNPRTGESVAIPASTTAKFRASQNLKARLTSSSLS